MAVESKVEESMADEFKPKESKGDDPWRMAHFHIPFNLTFTIAKVKNMLKTNDIEKK